MYFKMNIIKILIVLYNEQKLYLKKLLMPCSGFLLGPGSTTDPSDDEDDDRSQDEVIVCMPTVLGYFVFAVMSFFNLAYNINYDFIFENVHYACV